jgi:CSLREA domain-containing protein
MRLSIQPRSRRESVPAACRALRASHAVLLLAALHALPAAAGSFTVNSEADVPDDGIGDGECHAELGLPGVCTLRAAIQEANANPGADQIWLTAGQVYTLTRAGQDATASNGDLDIHDDVQVLFFASGVRPVVDADGLERAFEVHEGNVTLLGFDITGGDAGLPGDSSGGAIAINFDAGVVQLSLLRLYGNRANFGGGLYNDGAQTTVTACEFSGNEAHDDFTDSNGSAILNRGTLLVEQSGVFDNSGVDGLGAVAIENTPPFVGEPSLTLVNSSVALNEGIGIASRDAATLVVRNSTIAANSSIGVRIAGGDGIFQMRNSVVARNGNDDCMISVTADLNLDRYNMDSDDSCELSSGTSNYPGVEPYLTPPAYRGGFARSIWPLTRSPVIDQAHPVIGAIGCEEDDQDFTERPVDFDGDGNARCDVGAIELDDDVIFHDPYERL